MDARLMGEWMQSSTIRFWRLNSNKVLSIGVRRWLMLFFNRIMTPNTSPRRPPSGLKTMNTSTCFGQPVWGWGGWRQTTGVGVMANVEVLGPCSDMVGEVGQVRWKHGL